jgi:uncharacterized protein YndB with AHSA1/START domain
VSEIHIVRDYPHPPAKVWRAVTDPALIPLWTATGAGGTRFSYEHTGFTGIGGAFMATLLGHVRRKMPGSTLKPKSQRSS